MTDREPFLLGKGWVHSRSLIYLYGTTVAVNEANEFESVVVRWSAGEWGLWQVPARLCGVCAVGEGDARTIFCTGIDGYVEVSVGSAVHEEMIDDSEDGPNELRHILCARLLSGHVLAAGMSRMVYRRDVRGQGWTAIDQGVRVPRSSPEVAGFKAIDGDGQGRYVAVGFHGEIWFFERGAWRRLPSPTNVKLESVRWVDEDLIYIAGGGGTLLRGSPDALEVVEHTATTDTLWSIELFHGKLYVANNKGSLWTVRNNQVIPEKLPADSITTGWLHAADGVLLSVGVHHALLHDGTGWTLLEQPAPDVEWPLQW